MSNPHHAINAVSRRTGLSAHVIRIWEKRYGAVEPVRTKTKRRLYSEEQIERLGLLHDLTKAGHRIGQIAKLQTEELRKFAETVSGRAGHRGGTFAGDGEAASVLGECIAAVKSLESGALVAALNRGSTELGSQGLLQRVVAPLAQIIGDLWREGTIMAAHEHFASAVIRAFLVHAAKPFAGAENSPALVVTTPVGQLHELGALLAGAAAANLGWRVIYLGASLPAAEIAGAASQNHARVVALSMVYPEDDSRLGSELARLRQMLPPETVLLAGGRAMPAYNEALEKIGAIQIKDLAHLGEVLDNLRKPAKKAKQ